MKLQSYIERKKELDNLGRIRQDKFMVEKNILIYLYFKPLGAKQTHIIQYNSSSSIKTKIFINSLIKRGLIRETNILPINSTSPNPNNVRRSVRKAKFYRGYRITQRGLEYLIDLLIDFEIKKHLVKKYGITK